MQGDPSQDNPQIRIGTAGWAIPRPVAEAFPAAGSGLQRYAARFDAAEINSTFYRPHRPATLERWRDTTPSAFRFAIKAPRAVTHEAKLVGCEEALRRFVHEVRLLGDKLGPLLVQLPPSLAFHPVTAADFFAHLRDVWDGPAVCEPRHPSWFEPAADALLREARIARAAADPARRPLAGEPGGWPGLAYWRLHGSPHMYRSAYGEAALQALAARIRGNEAAERWCIFDNTTLGAAAANALSLRARLSV